MHSTNHSRQQRHTENVHDVRKHTPVHQSSSYPADHTDRASGQSHCVRHGHHIQCVPYKPKKVYENWHPMTSSLFNTQYVSPSSGFDVGVTGSWPPPGVGFVEPDV